MPAPRGWETAETANPISSRSYHTPENLNAYGPGGIDQSYVNRNPLPVAVQEWFDHVSQDPHLTRLYMRGEPAGDIHPHEALKYIGHRLAASGLDPMEHAHFTLRTGNPKYASAIMKLANKGNPRAIEHLERLGMPELAPGEYQPPEHHPEWPHTGRNPEVVVDPATGKPKIYRRRRYSYKSIRHPVRRY